MIALIKFLGIPGTILGAALLVALGVVGVQHLRWVTHNAEDAVKERAAAIAREAVHEQFEQRVRKINENTAEFIAKRKFREQSLERTIADLKSGKLPINPRFQCTAPANGGDAEAGHGVQPEDAEFLIREAAKSDEQGHQLELLQEWARTVMGVDSE